MAKKKKTWKDKLNAKKEPKKVRLEHGFGGMAEGDLMYVGTPQIVADYLSEVPFGETRTPAVMRDDIAKQNGCDGMCPVSTGIFLRIAAEAALESFDEGASLETVIPFWRVVAPDSTTAKKLPVDSAWIENQRQMEQSVFDD